MKINYGKIKQSSIICIFIWLSWLDDCSATLDLSNLDLENFQFFRYTITLPNGELRNVMPPPPSIESHFQRAKAVATFVQKLLFGNTGDDAKEVPFVFHPTVENLQKSFQQKYGYRGKYLVEQLGNGYFRYSSGYMPRYQVKNPK